MSLTVSPTKSYAITLNLPGGKRGTSSPPAPKKPRSKHFLLVALFLASLWLYTQWWLAQQTAPYGSTRHAHAPILVSYGYYEKDNTQRSNFEFFLKAGAFEAPKGQVIDFSFVISTDDCSPCKRLLPEASKFKDGPEEVGVRRAAQDGRFTWIFRTENAGMDIASHNVTFEYFRMKGLLWKYKYFFMINSSAKGPFVPSYMPVNWHWTHAYLVRFRDEVHAVSSSLVCLPDQDAGGPGPRIESWAFAVDQAGLRALEDAGALHVRRCKACKDRHNGIVVAGEYGIGLAMIRVGYNMATLMSKYAEDVDWRNPVHWKCNNNVHPSRHGTYDGIAFHPYETVFVKSSWHVADPYTARYATWRSAHLEGRPGTEGQLNSTMYKYAISEVAQHPNNLEQGYNLESALEEWRASLEPPETLKAREL